jgi:hypothetical protein
VNLIPETVKVRPPRDVRSRIHIASFNGGRRYKYSEPQRHGDFDSVKFWRSECLFEYWDQGLPGCYGRRDIDNSQQARASLVVLKALSAGQPAVYEKLMTPEGRSRVKDQSWGPVDIADLEFTTLKVTVEVPMLPAATLHAIATIDGRAYTGSVELVEEQGIWRVAKQTWTPLDWLQNQ